MASSSYDVFLSFKSEDTGSNFTSHLDNFTSHLDAALSRENIKTFKDDQHERGSEISQTLLKTIKESKISVVIFSKDYASSPWCLDKLVQMLECKRRNQKIVIPIFYHVDPSDVGGQTGCFAEAFAKHEVQFKDKVKRWRDALKEVAKVAGFTSEGLEEAVLVREITRDIMKKLNHRHGSSSLGIEERISRQKLVTIIAFLFFFWSVMGR